MPDSIPSSGVQVVCGAAGAGRSGWGSRGVQRISSEPFLCTAPLRPHSRLQVALKKAQREGSLAWSHPADTERAWNRNHPRLVVKPVPPSLYLMERGNVIQKRRVGGGAALLRLKI